MCIYPYDDNGDLDMRLLPLPNLPDLFTLLSRRASYIQSALNIEDRAELEQSYPQVEQDTELLLDLADLHEQHKIEAARAASAMLAYGYLN